MATRKPTRKVTRKRVKTAPVTHCVGYVRVSTDEQADSGLSLAAQRARVEQFAAASGWEMVGVFEDAGVSAKNLDRPALRAALAALGPGRILLALKIDRLTRSVPDLYELDALVADRGAEWATVAEKFDTSTATGRMMRSFIALVAEWERGIIAERTAAALGQKKQRVEFMGAPPLGFRVVTGADGGKILVEDATEGEVVALARQLAANGVGLREIARRLDAAGHRTKRGGHWEATTVRRLLQTRYAETVTAGSV